MMKVDEILADDPVFFLVFFGSSSEVGVLQPFNVCDL
jgi:hypothetical protein